MTRLKHSGKGRHVPTRQLKALTLGPPLPQGVDHESHGAPLEYQSSLQSLELPSAARAAEPEEATGDSEDKADNEDTPALLVSIVCVSFIS